MLSHVSPHERALHTWKFGLVSAEAQQAELGKLGKCSHKQDDGTERNSHVQWLAGMLGCVAGPGACQSAIWAGRRAGLGGEQGWTRKQSGPDLGVLAPPPGRPASTR